MIKRKMIASLAILLLPIGSLQAEEYVINKGAVTDNEIKITTIQHLDDETKVNFEYSGNGRLCIYPPGHVNAFYATDVRKTKKWFLLDTLDAPPCPKRRKGKQSFSILLERIDVSRFHLIEGEQQSGSIDWYFPNIKLKK